MRRIAFAGFEHQQREIYARHVHVTEPGAISYFGNGKTVMVVVKSRKPCVDIVGEDGLNEFGEPFVYGDYFLVGGDSGECQHCEGGVVEEYPEGFPTLVPCPVCVVPPA